MNFLEKLRAAWRDQNSLLCVGIDPDLPRLPGHFEKSKGSVFAFAKAIIDATSDLVCAYKPQIAYFSAISAEQQLEQITAYIRERHPHIPIILDAKRGDIGSTAALYAREAFERYQADAVTVNPYLGYDAIEPFLRYKERGIVLLCRTSNPGAGDIQDLPVEGVPLYERVAALASGAWNANGNCLLVAGASWPSQLERIRSLVGDMPLLVPGVGIQGGDVEQLVKAGQSTDGSGLIVSASRSVLYAGSGFDFAQAAREEALRLRNLINQFRNLPD